MERPANHSSGGCKPLTTFVQTDRDTFREVVQRLTGASDCDAAQGTAPPGAAAAATAATAAATAATAATAAAQKVSGIKRPTSKLHERRQYTRPKLEIVKPSPNFRPFASPTASSSSPGNHCLLQRSPVGTPSSIFSGLSIQEKCIGEPATCGIVSEEEEKAIKERRFYLHPSPRPKPGYTEPQLLNLFPLTSPKAELKP